MIKENYKDEVLPEGLTSRTYNVVAEDGQVLHTNVHLEKAYVPVVQGDQFGALQINEMAKSINVNERKVLKNVTIPSTSWSDDTTFPLYPFKADIEITGITADEWLCTLLTPKHTDRNLDSFFSPYVYVDDNKVTVFGKGKTEVVLENLVVQKAVV